MRIIRSKEFTAGRAWGATEIERIAAATVRLHWTDESYVWHVNDGPEVFIAAFWRKGDPSSTGTFQD